MRSYTVAIIKPDGVEKKLVGPILAMAGEAGLYPIEMEFFQMGRDDVDTFYSEHLGKDFFDGHAEFMTSGPSLFIYFAHDGALATSVWRALMGVTDPATARVSEALDDRRRRGISGSTKKSIRALWGTDLPRNVVHGSDSEESVIREACFLNFIDRWG